MIIRPATTDDVLSVAALKRRQEDMLYQNYGSQEEHKRGLDEYCSPQYLQRLLDNNDTVLLVALANDAVVGMGAITRQGSVAKLHALFVDRPGKGIGTAVLSALVLEAQGWKSTQVQCEFFERNRPALGFFMRRGFRHSPEWRPSETYSQQRLLMLTAPLNQFANPLRR